MMKEWHFNVLFCVGVGGAVFLLLAPSLGVEIPTNPTALAGVGTILTYVLTQKNALTRNGDHGKKDNKNDKPPEGVDDESG